MTTSRRLAAHPLLLIGLAALAALVLIPWIVQAQSQEVTATAAATGTNPPAVPTNLQASAVHDAVTLNWTASTDQTVTHYAILRRNPDTDASQVFNVIESNAGPETGYTDGSVSASSTYIYRVKAVSPTGVSQWSGYVKAETPAAPPPTPEDLRPTGLTVSLVENRVTLSWTAPAQDAASVDGYEILRRRPLEGETAMATLVADTESTATTYTDATANEAGVRYVYRVKALRGDDASLSSSFYAIDLPADYEAPQEDGPATATTPGAPGRTGFALSASDSIVFSWSKPADDGGSAVTGYMLEYSEDSGDTWQTLVEDTATTDTEYTHGGLEPETTLHYRVSAINEHGAGPPSSAFSVTTLPAPGIALPQVSEDSNVFLQLDQETATVLVKNTGQASSVSLAPDADYPKDAQGFTTGTNAAGYTLSSIGISFDAIADASNPGSELTVTLNAASGANPGSALCTLTDPATFSASSVNTFDAPTTDPCPTLTAGTTYFVVIERANNNTNTISYKTTILNAEDSGGATGWSIDFSTYSFETATSMWERSASQSILIEVKGYAVPNNLATGAPSISGVLEENEVLTADTVSIADEDDLGTFSYQWLAGGTAISGATSSTYTLQATEVGDAISLTVTFTDGEGNSESLTSAATHSVVASGATRKLLWVGTLTPADAGNSYIGFDETSYGSLSPSSFIDGSTTYAFEVIEFNTGFGLAIVVKPGPGAVEQVKWIFDAGGEFALADATHTVGPTNLRSGWLPSFGNPGWSIGTETVVYLLEDLNNLATGAPAITGLPRVGAELTADTSAIMDADGTAMATFIYQWVRVDGMTTTNIGTGSSTYTLTDDDEGKQVRVDVTFTDDAGNPEGPLSSEATATIVPADLLVKNTGQQPSSSPQDIGSSFIHGAAQAFTTGAYIRYELDSIGFSFNNIADTATAGSELTATLNEDNNGSPGKTLCILEDPPSFASSGTHTFTAPTTGDTPCPQLSANTTYFAVLNRANDYDDAILVNVAQNNNEDEGSLPGWTISSTGHFYQSGFGIWLSSSNEPRMIEVKGSVSTDTEITVPAGWSLIPSGLTAGDKFRLLFVTNTGHSPTSTDIADYNTYVQGQAAAGHADIQDYSSWFRVLGSTATTAARDNTETTSSDTAAAIYWLNGAKVADDYVDFYDQSWDDETNPRDRAGSMVTADTVWTGSHYDGRKSDVTPGVSAGLGEPLVRLGILNDGTHSPLHSTIGGDPDLVDYPYYALSGVLVVGAAVNNLATGAPAVTGTPRVGEVLTAGTSVIADEDGLGAFAYQWVRFDGPTQTNIGTDASTYTTVPADAGKKIKVRVSFTDTDGNAEGPLSSELTGVINDSATGVPTISGTPRVGNRLTASTSDIADPGGTDDADFTYQWVSVDGMTESNIGSNSSTYTLADADADKQIKVKVSFTDDEEEAEGPLESLLTESVVADDVLVQNTAQTANVIRAMSATNSGEAQQFTTGSHVAGYTLTSIGVNFNSIADTSTAGSELTVTLNEESSSNPGDALCTLDDPATFSASGLHTFTAPANGTLCPELAPSTNYLVVITRANIDAGNINLYMAASANIDSGSLTGWTIPNEARAFDGSAWSLDAGARMMVQVKGALDDEVTVHPDWSLTPAGLSAGDKFRLLFITGTGNPNSSNIATYNNSVQDYAANNGHVDVQDYNSWFRVVGSTESTDARDNTNTTSSDTGAFIYWLNGAKVADNYGDFYDGTWDDEANPRGANGAAITFTSSNNHVWTGSNNNGTEAFHSGRSEALGTGPVRSGRLNGAGGPLNSGNTYVRATNWRYYALSGLFVVSDANATPVFSADSATRTLPENSGAGVNVVGGVITATDRNSGDTLTYSLASSGDHGSFEIDSSTGQISTKTGVTHNFNFEAATNSYSVTVEVSDSKDADGVADTVVDDTIAVTIDLTNLDEAGTVTLPFTFTGGTEATASVSDPDGTVSGPSWQWARGNTATGPFSNISGATSAGYTPVAADVGEYLRATVTYTDPQGSGKSAGAVSSSAVEAGNAEPTFDDGATATRTLPENSGAGEPVVGGVVAATDSDSGDTLTYSLSGADAARFEIDSDGQIKVKTGSTHTFDFEATKKSYSVTVNVRDSKDEAGAADTAVDDTIAVTIDLTNVNEAPEITNLLTSSSAPENSSGTILLMASDVDVPDTQTWSVESDDDGDKFQVTGFLAALSFKDQPDFETPTDDDMNNTYVVTVKLTDSGGLSDTLTFTVTVTNVNEAPEITTNDGNSVILMEAENTATSVVIETFEADDVDASTTLTWSLEGADAGDFRITTNADGQGELKFRNVPDFEDPKGSLGTNRNVYIFTVKVRDNGSPRKEDTIGVNLHVTDVNEAPVITSPPATRSVPENSTAVHTFEATDVDASDTQTWSVESADDGGKFDIDSTTGALSFKNAPDFETPTDDDMNNTYVVTVKVTDAGGLPDTHTVTVTVTNVNEPPKITTLEVTDTSFDVAENTATSVVIKTYEAEDPDANSVLTWDLHGADAGDFTITKNAQGHGELKFRNVPNFEMPVDDDTDNAYDVTVRVRDAGGLSTTLMVEVTVTDVNETPVVSGDNSPDFAEIEYDVLDADLTAANYIIATYSATDDDNSDNANLQTITWDVSGDDAAHFTIDSTTGELSFSIRPDFENAVDMGSNNTYEIVVEADDGQGESNSVGTFTVTVTVTNVDETPEITTTASSHTAPSFMEIEYDATTADLNVVVYAARDEEDGTTGITWSLSGTDAGDFTISTDTATGMGTLTFRNRPNFEDAVDGDTGNDYEITVRARDTTSPLKTRELAVVVTVTDVNERPDIDEDTVSSYPEIEYDFTGTPDNVHTFTAEDYDMDTFEWSLLGTDAAYLEIGATTGVLTFTQDSGFGQGPLPNFEYPRDDDVGDGSSNTYSITVRATDDDASDQKFTDYAVVITVTDVNEQPEFTGTPDTAITLDEHDANTNYVVMDLADYDARDEEGGVTWSLTGTDRLDFAISADGVLTFVKTPNYEAPEDSGGDNVYDFSVVATDVASGSSRRNVTQAVTVTVGDVEEAGTLTVDNLSPAAGQTVAFRLTDPDGGIVTTSTADITWVIQSLVSGGSWTRVSGVLTPASATFPWTVDEDVVGKAIRAMVTYTDRRGSGKTALSAGTAEVTADPIANAPPRFRGVSSWSVDEGPAGGAVGTPTSATDRDNDTLTYGIQSGLDAALFEIDPSTGQVRLAQALDFETTSEPRVLFFYLTLHDGKGVDANNIEIDDSSIDATRSANVEVRDVEEDGVVTLSDDEPGVETAVTATLEDGDGGVTGEIWQWARSQNGQTGWTNISGATTAGYTSTQADADFFLRATVTYTDRRGAGKGAEAITAQRVFGENQRPTFPEAEDGQRSVPENTPAGADIGAPVAAVDPENGTLTYALSGTDAAAFTIVGTTGQIRVASGTTLDFETKPEPGYSVTVEVHDGLDGLGNASMTVDDTQAVTINVENVEEPGTVTLTTNAETILARVEVTAVLSDDDGPTVVAWQWSRSPNGRTDWVNIAGATSAAYTPTLEEDRGSYIRATASYTDGHGPNKTAAQVSARVGDPPPVNSAPVFPATENGRREVPEDATVIGAPVAATDLNAGDSAVNDPLAYSLTGTDAASFTIDAGTGQIRLAEGVPLDYEGKRTHRVTVEVTDGRDLNGDDDMGAIDARQNVTITVTNVNEAPLVTGDDAPSIQEDSSAAIATYTAADPERDKIAWSVSGADFWISGRGQLYFRSPPSFEAQPTYTVTVTATDDDEDSALSGTLDVTVTVTDAEEEGVVAITPTRGWVDVPTQFSASLTDDDGVVTGTTTWQWARSPNGRSSWTDITGATSSSYTVTTDDANQYLRASASYEDRRGSNKTASAALKSPVGDTRPAENTAPEFTEDDDDTDTDRTTTRRVSSGTAPGRSVGSRVRANDDDRGDVLTYSLSGTDGDKFEIDAATGQIRTKDVLEHDPDGDNNYEVTVSVHDGFDSGYNESIASDDTITVTITVTAVSQPRSGGSGGGSSGGGGGGGGSSGGGGGGGGVVVIVTAPDPPGFAEGSSATRLLPASARAGDAVGDPVVATHPDDSGFTYSLSGTDSARFTVDESTGQIRLGQAVSLKEGDSYTVTLHATVAGAGGSTTTVDIEVSIRVTEPDPPGFAEGSGATRLLPASARSGDAVGDPVVAMHPDDSGFTYSLSGTDSARFTVDESTGQIRLGQAASLEEGGSYTVTLQATAAWAGGSTTTVDIEVSIRVTAPDPPGFAEGSGATRLLPASARSGDAVGDPVVATHPNDPGFTYSLSGTDSARFTVDESTGQIRLGQAASLEEGGSYTVTLQATAAWAGGSTTTVDIEVSIRVTAPDPPGFAEGSGATRLLPASARSGDAVGDPVVATHPNDPGFTYSLSGTDSARFTVDESTGQIRLGQAVSLEEGGSYTVTLQATAAWAGGSTTTVDIEVSIRVTAPDPPGFAEGSGATRLLPASARSGDAVGDPVVATHPNDPGFTYSLSGTDSARFTVDESTGQIRLGQAASLEEGGSYTVTLQATAAWAGGSTTTVDIEVSIRVTAPDPPGFAEGSGATRLLPASARSGDAVGDPVVATHPNDPGFTYSLSGTDSARFTVDESTGQIRLGQAVSLEEGGSYTVTLQATAAWAGGSTTTVDIEVSIRVTAPDPPGFAEGSGATRLLPASARSGDAVGDPVVATHPNDPGFTYSLSGTDSARFTVDESTGQIRLGQAASLEEGGSYTATLQATAAWAGGSTTTVEIEVSIRVTAPDPPSTRYDLNRNGTIERDEVLAAIGDYLAGLIERDDVLALVLRYFAA